MIRINLLPVRLAKEKENIQKQLSVYVLSTVFTLAVMSYFAIAIANQVTSLAAELQVIQSDTKNYDKIVNQLEKEKKQKEKIQEKLGLIQALQKAKSGPVHILDTVCSSLPDKKLWLNAMTQDQKGMTLKGVAMDNETVAQYMRNLSRCPYLTSVDLQNAEQQVVSDKKLMQFVLICQIKSNQVESK